MERRLLKAVAQVTAMNTKMLVQIYALHHDLCERTLALAPDSPDLLSSLSSIEQMQAALADAQPVIEQLQKDMDSI